MTLASSGVLPGDSLTYADTSATFANKNVANSVGISVAGITETGTGSGNYTVNSTAATGANITPLGITVTATGINKVYDDGLAAAVTLAGNGVLPGDSLAYTDTSAVFANKNVANGVPISVAGITQAGTGSGNYTVNGTASTSASITPAIINLTGTRVYDGLTDANASIFGAAGTVNGVAGENLVLSGSGALATKNVISNGAMSSISGLTLGDGTGLASNYQLSGGSDVVTVIPLAITVAGTASNKTYDGTTAATVTLAGSGVLAGDTVNFADSSATFNTRDVATANTVTIAGITAGGRDGANYALSSTTATASANITPATLTETAIPVSVAAGQVPNLNGSLSGFVPGDNRANATVGTLAWITNAPVAATPGVYAIDGSGLTAGNYVLVQSPRNADALTITAALVDTSATQMASALFETDLAPQGIATPYGVGSADDYGNNTGNARRDINPADGNRHLNDFTGRLALTVIGPGINLPAQLAP